ncbi:MAG: hypothetical protein AAFQ87_18920, partial [Bacteroidota bacterium]
MKIHFFFCIVLFLLCLSSAQAQQTVANLGHTVHQKGSFAPIVTFDQGYKGVQGSPYLSEYFSRGTIWLRNGGSKDNLPMVLNLYERKVEISLKGIMQYVPYSVIDSFVLEDSLGQQRQFQVQTILTSKKVLEDQLLEKIYEGESLLYRVHIKNFSEANYEGTYSRNQHFDRFDDEFRYYLRLGEAGNFQRIRLKQKSCLRALHSQKSAVKTYIKQEKLRLEDEAEIIQLLG